MGNLSRYRSPKTSVCRLANAGVATFAVMLLSSSVLAAPQALPVAGDDAPAAVQAPVPAPENTDLDTGDGEDDEVFVPTGHAGQVIIGDDADEVLDFLPTDVAPPQ